MFKKTLFVLAIVSSVTLTVGGQDARSVVAAASKAMGADQLKTIQYSGPGTEYSFGQAYNPGSPWPAWKNKSYTRTIDFDAPALRIERVADAPEPGRKGGGLQPGAMQQLVVNANTPWAAQLPIWITPYGFLRQAAANTPTMTSQTVGGKKYTVVTFIAPNKAKVNGYIDSDNMVAKVETWMDTPVLGDTLYEAVYSNYKDFGGVKVPTRIVEQQGDYPTLEMTVADAKINAPANIAPPQRGGGAPGGGGAPPAGTSSQKLADGVFLILPGYAALAVDMKDGIVVIEGPQSDARGEAIIAEVKKDIPNKAIRYVVNTHGHFDHSSGLRPFVAEGATIMTHQVNKGYFEKIFARPHTLNPDRLAQNKAKVNVETVGDKKVLTDGTHTIELYRTQGTNHNEGLLFAYLPKEKILVEADSFNPPAQADAPPAATPSPANVNLLDNISRLKLDVETIVPIHYPPDGRKVTIAELKRAVGARSTN
jgi:glyoxylase-like metal-dependent hydrolase (beta-lactamase superfamily II)